ncbi:MAG: ABC transporter ATP-binding protein [Dehalococcoidia bacterium]|nr:ABC transporter ATP-binding protein [Dehalococcoidia bacterium]
MLEVKNLVKTFKGRTVVKDISFSVGEGEVFGYLGPNGAGKTTTMRLILGLLKPTSGEALLWGKLAAGHPDIRQRIGVLLESDGVYPRLSAYDNLAYFGHIYGVHGLDNRIGQLLDFAGLSERRHDKVGTFSRGMRRKLGLVRALLHSPDILLLDEPSAGLDPESQKRVRDLIVTLSSQSQITVFLNSHDLDEVQRICGRVAIIQDGLIRVCDTLKALQSAPERRMAELVPADASRCDDIVALMRIHEGVVDVTCEERSVFVTLHPRQKTMALVSTLEKHGIEIEEIRRAKRSLEDIYLEVVGGKEKDV